MKFREVLNTLISRKRKTEEMLQLRGHFEIEHWRAGKLYQKIEGPNTVVNVGKNLILDVMFHSGSQIGTSSWVMGLISDASFSGIVAADTMGSHAGWTESSAYSEANRPAWGQGAASSQVITNGSPAVFSINGTAIIKGIFITSQNTKGGTTGTLWSAMLFPTGDTSVINGDELRATYSIGA